MYLKKIEDEEAQKRIKIFLMEHEMMRQGCIFCTRFIFSPAKKIIYSPSPLVFPPRRWKKWKNVVSSVYFFPLYIF